ncbi:MAG: type II toxin-antitoxin system RelE/ParE family toxin [Cyclobacteriaceae bacterium]
MANFKIIWSIQAKTALKDIFNYYKKKSLQAARNVKSDLLNSPKSIYFSKQYQIDDINPKYRRIVVRHYKVLYLEKYETIQIVDIVSTLKSPEILKNK